MADPTKNSSDTEHQLSNDDNDLLQDRLNVDEQGDMPRTEGIVFETIQRPEVSHMLKNIISDKFVDTVAWPEKGTLPESECKPGFFRKSFPKLFPDGRGDITCPGFGKDVSFSNWVKHLLRADRRFASDPL